MTDTIAAPVTPLVTSALGVVRVSGQDAVNIANTLFDGLAAQPDRTLRYGRITGASGELLDMGMAVTFRAPRSYTGEDVVEFHCHGSPAVIQSLLSTLYDRGARPATAGEFTKRAFLNGRMDLTQVEATLDLIESETPLAARNAAEQAGGALGRTLLEAYDAVTGICAGFQAAVDYPEEDLTPADSTELCAELGLQRSRLTRLLDTYGRGQLLREGVKCAIVGKPNTGKSSLLNALLGDDRVIVSDIPGTTRDTVEASLRLGGLLLRVSDTAGLRQSLDVVEALGMERAMQAARAAKFLFVVLDGSRPLDDDDRTALDLARGQNAVIVVNKSDLPLVIDMDALEAAFTHVCAVCALTGEGIGRLDGLVRRLFDPQSLPSDGTVLTNLRQAEAVRRSIVGLDEALAALSDGVTADVVLTELEFTLDALAEVLGKRISEDIVNTIFSRFCVGK